jgi:DNA-binding beta-propeller fold protein YncE
MTLAPTRTERPRRRILAFGLPVLVGLAVLGIGCYPLQGKNPPPQQGEPAKDLIRIRQDDRIRAPELDGGVGWLNTSGPLHLRDLRGKIVLVDFWTLCCINCIHTLPDLAKLEKKYPNQLVVIGVHSAKFNNEKNSESIRKAILRYEINHPVVNDANMRIWRNYGVNSWPTLCLIDPEGFAVGMASGEGLGEVLDNAIAKLIKIHREKKTLNEQPLRFDLARYRERRDSPLSFPGKVVADATGNRLFIADSTNHRIVITDLAGKKIAIAGTGQAGREDGPFEKAAFNDPQGMALVGDLLYVADRKNHCIRALDLKAKTVQTVAGTGEQGQNRFRGGAALQSSLNSPWDLLHHNGKLYIAMAGHHQIWVMDPAKSEVALYAGNGRENIMDGPLDQASFAQPSGLATDGTTLYVADSEVSAVRAVPLGGKGEVTTVIGEGLFEFGDEDGIGKEARLQHALGVAWHGGKLYVADTYNSKIKVIDPAQKSSRTFLGARERQADPLLDEPGGLSFAGDKLYVADTNANRIRVVDLKSKAITTLELQGVEAPKPAESARPDFPNPTRTALPAATVSPGGELTLAVELRVPAGAKLNPEAAPTYVVETLPEGAKAWVETKTLAEAKPRFDVKVPAAKINGAAGLRLSLVYYECGSEGLCRVKSLIWDVPLKFDAAAKNGVVQLTTPVGNGG